MSENRRNLTDGEAHDDEKSGHQNGEFRLGFGLELAGEGVFGAGGHPVLLFAADVAGDLVAGAGVAQNPRNR